MKIDSKGNVVEWMDMRETLAAELKGLPYELTLKQWELWDKQFQELEGGIYYIDWVRSMILVDRYYLLINVLLPESVKPIALHPWLFARCRDVEAEPDGVLDLWHREAFKTSIITHAGSIQEILRNPEITIAIFSHTKATSQKIVTQIKADLENNPTLKTCFPDVLYDKPDKHSPLWTKDKFIVRRKGNPREATCEAHGLVDGMPTGAHFKLRVYDDLVTDKSVNTPEQINKTTEALSLSDNLGSEGGKARYVGTRYSLGDTYQTMIEKGQVKVRIHPATHNGTLEGKPVFFSEEYWESKKKNQTMSTLACQMLQNPNAGSQALFLVHQVNFYFSRPQPLNVYIMVDPANDMKKSSDRTAMAVIGIDAGFNKFLLDGYNHRMKLNEKWQKLRGLVQKWSQAPGVEQLFAGYEKYGGQNDLQYFEEQMDLTGTFFPITVLNTPRSGPGSKRDRMGRLEPDFRNGRIYLPAVVTEDAKFKLIRFVEEATTKQPILERRALDPRAMANNLAFKDRDYGARPIRQINEDGKVYDLTLDFIRQAESVPNDASHDDLVDAVSRIYDMDVFAPKRLTKSRFLEVYED